MFFLLTDTIHFGLAAGNSFMVKTPLSFTGLLLNQGENPFLSVTTANQMPHSQYLFHKNPSVVQNCEQL